MTQADYDKAAAAQQALSTKADNEAAQLTPYTSGLINDVVTGQQKLATSQTALDNEKAQVAAGKVAQATYDKDVAAFEANQRQVNGQTAALAEATGHDPTTGLPTGGSGATAGLWVQWRVHQLHDLRPDPTLAQSAWWDGGQSTNQDVCMGLTGVSGCRTSSGSGKHHRGGIVRGGRRLPDGGQGRHPVGVDLVRRGATATPTPRPTRPPRPPSARAPGAATPPAPPRPMTPPTGARGVSRSRPTSPPPAAPAPATARSTPRPTRPWPTPGCQAGGDPATPTPPGTARPPPRRAATGHRDRQHVPSTTPAQLPPRPAMPTRRRPAATLRVRPTAPRRPGGWQHLLRRRPDRHRRQPPEPRGHQCRHQARR